MSSIRITLAICTLAVLAACGAKQDEVVLVDEPVQAEPVFTGKYK